MLFNRTKSPSLSPREASTHPDLQIVDVRTLQEWRTGHVPDAQHIPLDELPRHLSKLNVGQPIAFICQSGARSKRATKLASQAGLDAINIDGGMLAWQRAGLPTNSH